MQLYLFPLQTEDSLKQIWETLKQEQQDRIVEALANMITKAVLPEQGEEETDD